MVLWTQCMGCRQTTWSNRPELLKKFTFPTNSDCSKAWAGIVCGYADSTKYLGFLLKSSSERLNATNCYRNGLCWRSWTHLTGKPAALMVMASTMPQAWSWLRTWGTRRDGSDNTDFCGSCSLCALCWASTASRVWKACVGISMLSRFQGCLKPDCPSDEALQLQL